MVAPFSSQCTPATFTVPVLFGADNFTINAALVTNYSASVRGGYRLIQPDVELRNATFCNITVTYTHPGQNDNVTVEAWLPPPDKWNERLYAAGGGGHVAGRVLLSYEGMRGALAEGFASITTDAGLGAAEDAAPWALLSPGNVDLYKVQNLASTSLNDEAVIGKSLIRDFYGKPPVYSYWNGCSQGGRQGLMLAQRYPTAFDGIAVGAPGVYFTDVLPSLQWAQQVMNQLGVYPHGCEIDAITAAAVSACDGLDGVVDGIVADGDGCLGNFDPSSVVGKTVDCKETGGSVTIGAGAAAVVAAVWKGRTKVDGKVGWFGLTPGTDLTGSSPYSAGVGGVAVTNCTSGACVGVPNFLGTQWLQLFVAKDASFDVGNLTHREFDELVRKGKQEYRSMLDTDDGELANFREAGGKLVSWHGLADELVPPKGTEKYYREVASLMPDVHEFYRHFEIAGLGHCLGGISGQPSTLFSQLRAWVENGTAPSSSPVDLTYLDGKVKHRIACSYPRKARLSDSCGDAADASCWTCGDDPLKSTS